MGPWTRTKNPGHPHHQRQAAGRTTPVTGSSGGIGKAVARVLAASGAEVVVSGPDAGRSHAVVEAIIDAAGRAHALTPDLGTEPAGVRTFARQAADTLGGALDTQVNNTGMYPGTLTETVTNAEMQALWPTNVRAPHMLVTELAPQTAERGSEVIMNIGP